MSDHFADNPVMASKPGMGFGGFGSQFQQQNHQQNQFGSYPVDCMITEWSDWSPCTATCGKAWKEKFRMIKVRLLLSFNLSNYVLHC